MEDSDILLVVVTRIMFDTPVKDIEDIVAQNPSIPKYLQTKEFSDKVQLILFIKERIVRRRWSKFVDTCYSKMFSSHQAYLTFVMFACIRESERNQNIFEAFISVRSLLNYICLETHQKAGVHLSYLNPLIFVHFCDMIRDNICRQGGGQRLVDFIDDHRYLNYNFREIFALLETDFRGNPIVTDLYLKIEKELERDRVMEEEIDADEVANNKYCLHEANKVLQSRPGIDHKNLPSLEDVVKNLVEYRKKERAEGKLLDATLDILLDKSSNSIAESKTNDAKKYQDNIEQYENIIQAVIRHNHSKSSGLESANNKIQEAANGVLQHLKETIEKLTKVLKEFDK